MTSVWKNLIGFSVLLGAIFGVLILKVPIHFSVFENIKNVSFNGLIFPFFMVVTAISLIVFVIVIVILYVNIIHLKIKEWRNNER